MWYVYKLQAGIPSGWRITVPVLVVAGMIGCGGMVKAPVESRTHGGDRPVIVSRTTNPSEQVGVPESAPAYYFVRDGDSLYTIAWRYGINYLDLVDWNNLRNPDLIYPGQRLALRPPARVNKPSARTTQAPKPKASTPSSVVNRRQNSRTLKWAWPTNGRPESIKSALGSKGLKINGQRGQRINAAAGGEVVYSGSGLRGYGKLIIIKHNTEFLSAYAHIDRIFVKEGVVVAAGEKIAEMGDSGAKQVMLHFEIRRNGVAVEPSNYLPKRNQ